MGDSNIWFRKETYELSISNDMMGLRRVSSNLIKGFASQLTHAYTLLLLKRRFVSKYGKYQTQVIVFHQ